MRMQYLLIIEDDEVNCMLYEDILYKETLTIDFAYDGQQGVDKFKSKAYDLIILDIGLPKISGLKVANLIREHEELNPTQGKIPIIVITANSFPGTEKLAMEAGVDAYMTKPFDIHKLRSIVSSFLQKTDTLT